MQIRPLLAAAAVALMAACDQPAAIDPAALSAAEAAELAPIYEALTSDELAALGIPSVGADVAADPITTTITFSRTRSCPRGGSVLVEGSLARTADRETRTATHQYAATRTEQACAFGLPSGGTLTITGDPSTAVTGSWTVVDGVPGVRTVTHRGAFTWARSGGGSGRCAVDLTATWDPATRTHRVVGTFCGRTVDVTRTRG